MAYMMGLCMTLRIEIAETERFKLDCAMYGLERKNRLRAFAQVQSDPVIGKPVHGEQGLRRWTTGGLELTYALSDDISRVVFLTARPPSPAAPNLLRKAMHAIDHINRIKRLFGF